MRPGASTRGNMSGDGTATAGPAVSCTYHGWALCPLKFSNGTAFPFDEPTDMVRIGRLVAHRQLSNRKKGTPSKIGITPAGCKVHARSGKIKVPLLNISQATMLSPWISMVVSKTSKVVVIMALARDQHGEVGVGCDVVQLGSRSGAAQLAELAAQFSASLMEPACTAKHGVTGSTGAFTLQPVRAAVPELPPRNKNNKENTSTGRPRRRTSNNRRGGGGGGHRRAVATPVSEHRNAWADSDDSPAYETVASMPLECNNDGGYIDINHSNDGGYVDIDFGDCDAHYMSVTPVAGTGGDNGYMTAPPMYSQLVGRSSSCISLTSFSEALSIT